MQNRFGWFMLALIGAVLSALIAAWLPPWVSVLLGVLIGGSGIAILVVQPVRLAIQK